MKTTFLAAAAILGALGSAPPAAAETITFTGTVTTDWEVNMFGVSGQGNNTFVGDTFTDTFQLNTANGYALIDSDEQEYMGGTWWTTASPLTSTATFGGQSASFAGSVIAWAIGQDCSCGGGGSLRFETLDTDDYSNDNYVAFYEDVSAYPFSFQSGTGSGEARVGVNNGVGSAWIDANITSVTAVPEASTWAMMLAGFAGLGYAGLSQDQDQADGPRLTIPMTTRHLRDRREAVFLFAPPRWPTPAAG
jgi:hypothetical protein